MRFKTILLGLFILLGLKVSAQVRVSILVDDNYGRVMRQSTERIYRENPQLKGKCDIRTYPFSKFFDMDLTFLESSDLIFVHTHNPRSIRQAEKHVRQAIKNGAKVYPLNVSAADKEFKQWGFIFNAKVIDAFKERGEDNVVNLILFRLKEDFNLPCSYRFTDYPVCGIYDYDRNVFEVDFQSFLKNYKSYKKDNPWIGVVAPRHDLLMAQQGYINTHIRYIENAGFNVLPVYGYPAEDALKKYFQNASVPPMQAIVAMGMWHGVHPAELEQLLRKIQIPVINCVQLAVSRQEWENSTQGIGITNRGNLLAIPEISGQIQPIVTSVSETNEEGDKIKVPVYNQVRKLVARLKAWYALQVKPNAKKQIALIYYSYPPGKENIGASYLNVLPQSLLNILNRLKAEGYDVGTQPLDSARLYDEVMQYGRNIGKWAQGEIDDFVSSGRPVLVPLSLYKQWYAELSPTFRSQVESKWGKPEENTVMSWEDKKKGQYIVLPAIHYGNILLTTQPARGDGSDPTQQYHDITMPPHHQYIAFYLWLRFGYRADAVIHLGTHGTHEWLSGKEAGLNSDDAPEALIGDMPNIYPYIVDDVGEGLQAKRRGVAVIIDHMTPPFDRSGLNPELRELADLISDYEAAMGKSEALAASKVDAIYAKAEKAGLMKDLGIIGKKGDEVISKIEHYIKEISEKNVPYGLHAFGRSPQLEYAQTTARTIAGRLQDISSAEKKKMTERITQDIISSGNQELQSLIDALNGKYIHAGKGNDPLRNPASLPTGKNFYAFDPALIPDRTTFDTGRKLAEEMIMRYREEHGGKYPEKVTMNLWSTECIRHEGIMESQILYLLGVKPVYNAYGCVKGVEAIPRQQLGRPRIDVTIVPSGLYRDLFPNLMQLLDSAVHVVKQLDETDNYVRAHIQSMKRLLMKEGVKDEDLAEKLASVRMFSVPPGAYGTGISDVVGASGTWDNEQQVADVYFNRMGHLYGQGFWGDKVEDATDGLPSGMSVEIFKKALSGTDVVMHSRSSNLYGALDNDDFFQYLGATAMAIRSVDGKTPDVIVTNLSNPAAMGQETLDKFIGREMQSRYLNPEWIKKMLNEGYAGARFINKVVYNMWGWQVTVPEAIDENKWQQMYETYIEDKYQLDIREKFKESGNLYAYQTILSRMIETVRKDYWHPDDKVLERMLREFEKTIEEVGLSCNGNVCDNAPLANYINNQIQQLPNLSKEARKRYENALKEIKKSNPAQHEVPSEQQLAKQQSPTNSAYMPKTTVEGYEMEEVKQKQSENNQQNDTVKWGLLLLIGAFLVAVLFRKR